VLPQQGKTEKVFVEEGEWKSGDSKGGRNEEGA